MDLSPVFFIRIKWFRGRVARQRSAKPSTAVRIRSKPLVNHLFGWFFYLTEKAGAFVADERNATQQKLHACTGAGNQIFVFKAGETYSSSG